MGHYDNCRPGFKPCCGQVEGVSCNCEAWGISTPKEKKKKIKKEELSSRISALEKENTELKNRLREINEKLNLFLNLVSVGYQEIKKEYGIE